jgi:hypothetical protein
MDEAGLSARQVADHLGQADITTTQRHYLGRTKVARVAAGVLDAIDPRDRAPSAPDGRALTASVVKRVRGRG